MEAAAVRDSASPGRARAYVGHVWPIVGLAVLAGAGHIMSGPELFPRLPAAFWAMAVLAVACDVRPLTSPRQPHRIAVFPSICFAFAILLLWGFGPAVAVQAVAVISSWRPGRGRWLVPVNLGKYGCALAAAAVVIRIGAPDGLAGAGLPGARTVAVVVGAAAAWLAVEYGAELLALRLLTGARWWLTIRQALPFELLATASLLLLGPILAVAARASVALVPLILVPLYAVHRMSRLTAEQERLTLLDPLTGLGNRKALVARVAEQVATHAEYAAQARSRQHAEQRNTAHGRTTPTHEPTDTPGPHLALLLLDLDRFKHINDALGHAVGDRLLVQVGKRLSGAARPSDLVVRLGGDEFAVLAGGLRDVAEARELADRIAGALSEPVALDGLPLDVGGSIGIALFPQHGLDFATLLRHADVAMYDAKQRGDTVAVYAPESDHNSPERLSLLADLRRVLEGGADAGELTLYYQPQIAMDSGDVVGVEALLRWRHPRRGMVDPEELIRVAEQSTVMRLLTRRVVDEVTDQLAKWSAAGLPLRAAINVSVRDLHTGEIVDQIAERLTRHGLSPDRLELEITEGALMADPRRVLTTISRLDRLGIAIALDDFGTGYSSMQHLRRFPLAEVKIDRSFVLAMAADTDDAAIVRSVIELASALGLRVVAEGVEDERTWRLLHAAGCHVAQGWFYARPMPADELAGWLARYRPIRPTTPAEPVGRHRLTSIPPVPGPVETVAHPGPAQPGPSIRPAPPRNTSPALRSSPSPRQAANAPAISALPAPGPATAAGGTVAAGSAVVPEDDAAPDADRGTGDAPGNSPVASAAPTTNAPPSPTCGTVGEGQQSERE